MDEKFVQNELKNHIFRSNINAWIVYPIIKIDTISLIILDVKEQKLYRIRQEFDYKEVEKQIKEILASFERSNVKKALRSEVCDKCVFNSICEKESSKSIL